MKTKITSVMLALVCAGTLTAAAATPATVDPNNLTFEQALGFCADAFADYQKTRTTNYLDRGMALLPNASVRGQVAQICAAYGAGYIDGVESMVRKT